MPWTFWILIAAIVGIGLVVLRFRYELKRGWRKK